MWHKLSRWQRWRSMASITLALAVMLALLSGTGTAHAASRDYIVMLKPGVSLQAHLKAMKITPNRIYTSSPTGFEAVLNDTQYKRELASSNVRIITPNTVVATVPTIAAPPADPTQPPQFVTRGIRRIGGLVSPTAAIDGIDTRVDVDIAVVDTGVDRAHPDLNVVGGTDCVGRNAQGNNGAFVDKEGHGTMVAGFAGAIDNTIGAVGVAPGARIWAIQVSDGGGGHITNGSLLCAIDWITSHADTIEVANLSLGGPFHPHQLTGNCGIAPQKQEGDPTHAAICASVAAGVTYVVAAGNETSDATDVTPASYPEVIAASAIADSDGAPGALGPPLGNTPGVCDFTGPFKGTTMPDDTFAAFSNFGQPVDVAAPGVCISSTYPGGLYSVGSGTSFSTPLVAGAAALYISTHPAATPAHVQAALIAAAEPGPITGDPDAFPEGIVNVAGF
jgi:subtilisin